MSVGPEIIPKSITKTIPSEGLGSLLGCLVEGDAEQRQRERHVHRRALAISIILQTAALTVLVLVPLFAKTERIAVKDYVPIPPYDRPSNLAQGHNRLAGGQTTTTVRHFHFWPLNHYLHPLPPGVYTDVYASRATRTSGRLISVRVKSARGHRRLSIRWERV